MSDHEHLSAAAEKMGMPESLVLRSAEAKAKAQGVTVDDLLAEWAGVSEGAATPAEPTAPEPAAEAPEPAEPAAEATPVAPEPATPAVPAEPIEPGEPEIIHVDYLPTPETVDVDQAHEWAQVTTVKNVGLKERTTSAIPSWLMAFFAIVPLVAVFYIGLNAEGPECGQAGALAVDFEGNLLNCDGTAFAPGGGGGGAELQAAFAEGQELYATCAGCHGDGGGGGTGPAMNNGAVVETFGACTDHIEWVNLGSANWPDATYGDNATPVGGGMPGYANQFSPEEVQAVILYERVAFGGLPLEEAGADCGFEVSDGGGEGGGVELTALLAEGQEYYSNCAACHGDNGGGGTGPAMNNGAVVETFGACTDHIEWIKLGSANWPDATYGDNETPVAGGMPGYETQTDERTIAAVALFERVQFGNLDLAEAAADCGLTSGGEGSEGE
ncbi:MAG: c-type cytochrome, partial [Acidimicrobiia bacterium]